MKAKIVVILSFLALGLFSFAQMSLQFVPAGSYVGNSFLSIWEQVANDPTDKPHDLEDTNHLSLSALGGWSASLLKDAVTRTLNSREDLKEKRVKLAHPNGICMKGHWQIDDHNLPYVGLFQAGAKGLIIARASTALNETKKSDYRAFGLAGKVFPTQDEHEVVETANFFLVDDLGGTKADHYTDVELSNTPPTSKNASVFFKYAGYIPRLLSVFGDADLFPSIRQLYQLSESNGIKADSLNTPLRMKVRAINPKIVDEPDFRRELEDEVKETKALVFEILVSQKSYFNADKEQISIDQVTDWRSIGTMNFSDTALTESCDRKLHFAHPKWRSNLE